MDKLGIFPLVSVGRGLNLSSSVTWFLGRGLGRRNNGNQKTDILLSSLWSIFNSLHLLSSQGFSNAKRHCLTAQLTLGLGKLSWCLFKMRWLNCILLSYTLENSICSILIKIRESWRWLPYLVLLFWNFFFRIPAYVQLKISWMSTCCFLQKLYFWLYNIYVREKWEESDEEKKSLLSTVCVILIKGSFIYALVYACF